MPATRGSGYEPIDEPIRAELFSVERLEEHGRSLAEAQELSERHGRLRPISRRLVENGEVLLSSYRELSKAIREEALLTPAAEWLVDNFHLVESQLHEIRDNLPSGYYRELPKLDGGHLAGYPRVYGIVWAYVSHLDSRFDPEALRRFVASYQGVAPLTIGELWAIPITLRLILIENLRRMTESIIWARRLRREAEEIADGLLGVGGGRPGETQAALDRYGPAKLPQPFAVQLLQRLRDQDPETTPGLTWLLDRLNAAGTSPDEIVGETHRRQAATNVTVRNIVTSLRQVNFFDWADFVEGVSLVDHALAAESSYSEMSFATRDRYRHAIEELSKGSGTSELDVTKATLRLADPQLADRRQSDPGFYLLGEGRTTLEAGIGFRPGVGLAISRFVRRHAAAVYLSSVAVVSALLLALPLLTVEQWSPWGWVMAGLALIPASDMGVILVNRAIAALTRPEELPSLGLAHGPTAELRTLVAIPALLTRPDQVEELVERLEVHYLANPDGDLHFALVSDWRDAEGPELADDAELLAAAADGVLRLNERHGPGPGGADRFLLFHRRRLFNPGEELHMGWERKRGKLHELNRLLRGATDTSFIPSDRAPTGVRFVIALDADARLPPGAATRLVATIAHPLNQARVDASLGRVVEGYGVLQPRVTAFLRASGISYFQRVFFPPGGIDPYAAAVSDLYQDLFGEGSYAGKGIYEIDAFEAALKGRIPENALLSHDLFEGSFARAGLVSNVEVFEEFPSHYEVALSRQHRWVRGDWQLLPWILGFHGPLPPVARLKMVDNLRRSLSGPAALFTLIASFILPGVPVWPWTAFILVALALPGMLPLLERIIPRRTSTPGAVRLRRWGTDASRALGRTLLQAAFLAHQALRMTEAIVVTLWRLVFTRRGLLTWVTAEEAERQFDLELTGFIRRMSPSMVVGIAGSTAAAVVKPEALVAALAWSGMWVLAPLIAHLVSIPRPAEVADPPTLQEQEALRLIARRTWRYFERFVTSDENWLPPDNFQEDVSQIAHRTSPTNIGLYLLAVLSAREFGWIGLEETVTRLENTVSTLNRLARYQGHFLNWYDTSSCEPLEPRYVSTVDSGNLAGHLLAVSQGCERLRQVASGPEVAAGIRDSALLLREAADPVAFDAGIEVVSPRELDRALVEFLVSLRSRGAQGSDRLAEILAEAETVADIARTMATREGAEDLADLAEALLATVRGHLHDQQVADDAISRELLSSRLSALADATAGLAADMDFSFLMNPDNKLLAVGYRVGENALDQSHYDLLASEARLASFVGIAKGDLPPSHWFRLGRSMTPMGVESALISWSGSMFEYLMPLLVMRSPPESILETTYRAVVRRQIEYGNERRIPWGISEAAYAARDIHLVYQYRAFGVPGLGFERGLSEDLVVAPYATLLATRVEPGDAVTNLVRLNSLGAQGRYGYYESLDFTPSRLPEDGESVLVRAYMAHHQAMSLISVTNVIFAGLCRDLFHADPWVRAAELLLHERVPRDVEVARPRAEEVAESAHPLEEAKGVVRRISSPHSPGPATHALSNGRLSTVITAAGSGYSQWQGLAVNRWREDATRDNFGSYFFIRDGAGRTWSAGYQPTLAEPDSYQVAFSEDKAEISRRDGNVATTLTVVVSEEDDAEVRRVSLTNLGSVPREVEVTSYAEIVLASARADAAHPAFSNLFVQTEVVTGRDALLASRRPRSDEEETVWAGHVLAVTGEVVGGIQYETDRARFLGRGNQIHHAAAVDRPLSNTAGRVLDPVFSLRRKVRIEPGATAHLDFTTVVAPTRVEALDLVDKFSETAAFERISTLAWTQAQVRLHHLRIEPDQAHIFQQLAGSLIYFDPALRAPPAPTTLSSVSQDGLWRHGISGDFPIVLVRIDRPEERGLVRDLLRAQEYWRTKGLVADLVIINEEAGSYAQELQDAIEELIRESGHLVGQEPDGGVFVLNGPLLTVEDRTTLHAAARALLLSHHGTLADQLARRPTKELAPTTRAKPSAPELMGGSHPRPDREFHNGLGGFAADGSEYVVVLGEGQSTPAPWVNVVANRRFGFCVSESGSGYSWSENSRENQLTPWSNDPVADRPGEVLYVRDEESGEVWGPTALPIRDDAFGYLARHGPGYSEFEHRSRGIALHLHQTVPLEDPIKISRLRIRNLTGRRRRLSITAYVEWVLGTTRAVSPMQIVTERDEETGAVLARNPWNVDFGDRVAFADLGTGEVTITGNRAEFLGRYGSVDDPAALRLAGKLSETVGVGLDPCAAIQRSLTLAPNEEAEVVFLLGQGKDEAEARTLVQRYRRTDPEEVKAEVATRWNDVLGTIRVKTPDRSFDLMINQWLLYQTLACRVLARTAFYQSGGAFGFRDQLQDVMALVTPMRDTAREHLLRAAAHQFEEGDVLHWWHEPSGKGVRTRISDDYLWLPYAVAHYLEVTGDQEILGEVVPYLRGMELAAGQDETFFTPERSSAEGTIFDHCRRALDRALSRLGGRGLPLIGTGDWNDGFNRVGREGRGESVWLGWFLEANLSRFADIADELKEIELAATWRRGAHRLRASLEAEAWDGDWYRRAFFDDGTPLGSSDNPECRIDSIAQSWSVIHRGAPADRAQRAMDSVEEYLVHRGDGLVLLFTPPFDEWDVDPGYIKGYLPGVRENGGQYTHAAIWCVIAFATLGDGDRAGELFSLLNPINHASTRAGIHRYRVEPYVAAADVYSEAPHVGRGGWTWYTGSAGWMYRAGVEWILGFRLRGAGLLVDPCIPRAWRGFEIDFRYHSARYEIQVSNPNGVTRGVTSLTLDGTTLDPGSELKLVDDGLTHRVRIVLG
ncbi:MAG TPA: glucoamylase family protein [Acidimicrobiia bacterium]|nr:glucoamylase family protein [Acidimicrobiia bacterium]